MIAQDQKDFRVPQECLDHPAPLALRDRRENPVPRDRRVSLGNPVALQVPRGNQDQQGHRVTPANLGHQENLVLRDLPVQKEVQGQPDPKENQEPQDPKDRKESPDRREKQVKQDPPENPDLRVQSEPLVQRVPPDLREQLALPDLLALLGLRGLRGLLEP